VQRVVQAATLTAQALTVTLTRQQQQQCQSSRTWTEQFQHEKGVDGVWGIS
jgi:hypothetical protein